MDSPESSRLAAPLAHRLENNASPEQVAEAIVAVWGEIDQILTPILGQRGVIALYKRSLFLCALQYPCLADIDISVQPDMPLSELKPLLARHHDLNAAAGNAIFQMFHELLTSLVGDSLTERLLRPVWGNSLSGAPAQDTSS
jgi:hypothetical protein